MVTSKAKDRFNGVPDKDMSEILYKVWEMDRERIILLMEGSGAESGQRISKMGSDHIK